MQEAPTSHGCSRASASSCLLTKVLGHKHNLHYASCKQSDEKTQVLCGCLWSHITSDSQFPMCREQSPLVGSSFLGLHNFIKSGGHTYTAIPLTSGIHMNGSITPVLQRSMQRTGTAHPPPAKRSA